MKWFGHVMSCMGVVKERVMIGWYGLLVVCDRLLLFAISSHSSFSVDTCLFHALAFLVSINS